MPTTANDGLELYYESVGQGPPVLWLQGLASDHNAWTVQKFHFTRRFRCLLPDNRDVGRSARASTVYELSDMARDALAVLDAAEVDAAHVVGLSMGSSIAQNLALLAPERVRSLTLLSAFARADARMEALLEVWCDLYPQIGRVMFHQQAEPWMFSPSFFEQPSNLRALRRYVEQDPHPQEADAFQRQVEASRTQDTSGRLASISVPALVVSGELDILSPPYLGRALADALPNAEFVERPGIAHSVNLEGQREFNQLLERFLLAH